MHFPLAFEEYHLCIWLRLEFVIIQIKLTYYTSSAIPVIF